MHVMEKNCEIKYWVYDFFCFRISCLDEMSFSSRKFKLARTCIIQFQNNTLAHLIIAVTLELSRTTLLFSVVLSLKIFYLFDDQMVNC